MAGFGGFRDAMWRVRSFGHGNPDWWRCSVCRVVCESAAGMNDSTNSVSSFASNFFDIGARLHEENVSRDKDKCLNLDFSRSREGSGRKPRPLPIAGLPSCTGSGRVGSVGVPNAVQGLFGDADILRRRPPNLLLLNTSGGDTMMVGRGDARETKARELEAKMREIMLQTGVLTVDGVRYRTSADELQHLGELGNGSCGHVVKMLHKESGRVIAVKQMRRSGNAEESKRIIMDLDVVLKSHDSPYIVQCLGCFITDTDVWICMELMTTCLDKLLKKLGNRPFPEPIIGKIAVSMLRALHYLKQQQGVIHRDVKPSNVLLDSSGQIKLCDFGISGRLVDSKAKTRTAGSAAYMAPERIEPPDPSRPDYDIRADVWSMGITLVELATGVLPYSDCTSEFEALTKVLRDDSPSLPKGAGFSAEFCSFVDACLTKNYKLRPKYKRLLSHEFILHAERTRVDVAAWFADVQAETSGIKTPVTRRRTPPHSPHQIHVHARRTPEPERFVPELWAPRGRFSERPSAAVVFPNLSALSTGCASVNGSESRQRRARQPVESGDTSASQHRRYISTSSQVSPLMQRRQQLMTHRLNGSYTSASQPLNTSPQPSWRSYRGSDSGTLYGRQYSTPEPHRRPFAYHRHNQYLLDRPL